MMPSSRVTTSHAITSPTLIVGRSCVAQQFTNVHYYAMVSVTGNILFNCGTSDYGCVVYLFTGKYVAENIK